MARHRAPSIIEAPLNPSRLDDGERLRDALERLQEDPALDFRVDAVGSSDLPGVRTMLQSIATGIVLTLCAAAAGVTFGQERLTAQGRESSDSKQAAAFHHEFAPASRVSEPYQILFEPKQVKASQLKLLHGGGPLQAHSSKRTVCGLTMMAVDPKADPKMSQPLQHGVSEKQTAGSAPEPKVRRIEPTVCRD